MSGFVVALPMYDWPELFKKHNEFNAGTLWPEPNVERMWDWVGHLERIISHKLDMV